MTIRERIQSTLRTTPYPFQVKGVRFLERKNGNALIGDEMGVGKTLQTIAYLAINPQIRPVVIFCPATLKWNWQREFEIHAGIETDVAEGFTPRKLDEDIWILNYDIAAAWLPWLAQTGKPMAMVMDECQRVANRSAKRTVACRTLAAQCKHVIALSGTPILNRPAEFWPVLNMIAPDDFKSFWEFGFRFCNPRRAFRGKGWDFSGASNLDELHARVSKFMIRRMKSEVLTDLPPKVRTIIPVAIDNLKDYEKARDDFVYWLTEKRGLEAVQRAQGAIALVRLMELKQLAALGKLKTIVRWVREFLAETDQKLLLFTRHKRMIRKLEGFFPGSAMIDGSVDVRKRQDIVQRFQTDTKQRTFLLNMKAGGEGLTLTAANVSVFTEIGWTPAEHDQAEARTDRIGQTADSVECFYFVGKGTVEETTLDIIDSKRSVINHVLNGDADADMGVTVQRQVIDQLLKGK